MLSVRALRGQPQLVSDQVPQRGLLAVINGSEMKE